MAWHGMAWHGMAPVVVTGAGDHPSDLGGEGREGGHSWEELPLQELQGGAAARGHVGHLLLRTVPAGVDVQMCMCRCAGV